MRRLYDADTNPISTWTSLMITRLCVVPVTATSLRTPSVNQTTCSAGLSERSSAQPLSANHLSTRQPNIPEQPAEANVCQQP